MIKTVNNYKLPFYFRIELVQGYYYICDLLTTPSKISSRFWLQAESKCKRAFSNLTGDSHCNETGVIKQQFTRAKKYS